MPAPGLQPPPLLAVNLPALFSLGLLQMVAMAVVLIAKVAGMPTAFWLSGLVLFVMPVLLSAAIDQRI